MSDGSPLRILLVVKHAGYIGVYEQVVLELAARGHSVHVGYLSADRVGVATLERLSREPRISSGPAPQRGPLDGWASVAWLARALGDLGRYSDPRFADASALRERMAAKVEGHLARSGGFDPLTRRLALRRARRLAGREDAALAARTIAASRRLESGVPAGRRAAAYIGEHAPGVVLVSPVVELASPLVDYLKAARDLGLRTGICVASWDNLTSKGLLRFVPERVFVWNETQRREAVELHGIPHERIAVTGAARFDDWFAQRPGSSRDSFMRAIGLDPARPYLLYLCSSGFVAPDEVQSVSRWLEAVRDSDDGRLRGIGVVVRPHPKRVDQWRDVDLARFENVVVWPRELPADAAERRAGFYDSIAHSAAVVGVNTSAMLEAAIVGKSVYALVSPEFAQEDTLHFHYLRSENGGFLHVAANREQHLAQLVEGLAREATQAEQAHRFVESFLRPGGVDRPATTIYADAVEELGRMPTPEPAGAASPLMRLALAPVALTSSLALAARLGRAALQSRLPRTRAAEPREAHVGPARV
jgi:hypothetical protein